MPWLHSWPHVRAGLWILNVITMAWVQVWEVWDAFLHRLDPIPTPRNLKWKAQSRTVFILVRKYSKWLSQLQPPSHPWLLMPLTVHRNSREHIFQLKLSTNYFLFSTNCSCVFIRWLFQDILRYVWVRFRSDSAMAFDQSLRRRLINWG